MKKIFKLLFTIILVLPIMVKASSASFELTTQKGGRLVTGDSLNDINIIEYNNNYMITPGGEYDLSVYQLYDKNYNDLIEPIYGWRVVLTKDIIIYMYLSGDTINTTDMKNTVSIEITNLKTYNKESFELEYDTKRKSQHHYGDSVDSFYFNEHGLIITSNNSTDIIKIDLNNQTLEKVDNTYCYNNYESPTDERKAISKTEYNKLVNYLMDKNIIYDKTEVLDYAVESENNYVTIVYKEGTGFHLLSTSKLLNGEVYNTSLRNEDFGNSYIYDVELFSKEKSVVVFLSAGYGGCPVSNNFFEDEYECSNTLVYQEYSPHFYIEKKTDGNGTIEAIEQSKSGEKIKYKVTPKEGYKVEKITIIDANGKSIEIKDNEFTMPSSPVLIEASFIVDNPNTSSNIYLGMAIIILVVGAFIIKKNKAKIDFIDK